MPSPKVRSLKVHESPNRKKSDKCESRRVKESNSPNAQKSTSRKAPKSKHKTINNSKSYKFPKSQSPQKAYTSKSPTIPKSQSPKSPKEIYNVGRAGSFDVRPKRTNEEQFHEHEDEVRLKRNKTKNEI